MLVIVASRTDQAAAALVQRWAAADARLLTCADLSVSGWRWSLGAAQPSTAVIGGQVVEISEISGVLTRLAWVGEQELPHIVPDDRGYVAAEMSAFLLSWLSTLSCSVLNRPTPTCLCGPGWRQEQWIRVAAQQGMKVHPLRRRAALGDAEVSESQDLSPATVTVIGDRCFGPVDKTLMDQARRLASVAGARLLTVRFNGPQAGSLLRGVSLWPDVSSPEIADALLEAL